jgi:hypothetical protein
MTGRLVCSDLLQKGATKAVPYGIPKKAPKNFLFSFSDLSVLTFMVTEI